MRPQVVELAKLGSFPSSDDVDVVTVKRFEDLIMSIEEPVTDEEARILVRLFGPDDFYELVWPLIHLIETAPGWPLEDALQDTSNEWIALFKQRVENARRYKQRRSAES